MITVAFPQLMGNFCSSIVFQRLEGSGLVIVTK